ncbi:MAG TPA: SH3 domain-containing protein [Rickettsiales bacterium]|nr:SH3 domain-containing protein [Rickettsiales bacterium]
MLKIIKIIVILILLPSQLFAMRKVEEQNYFASLRASETNVRAGPGQHYPVKFTFKAKNLPVRVISEYDNWNEIEDYEGQTGWVNQSLLTKKRSLLIRTTQNFINMYSKSNEKSRVIYHLENHVIGDYIGCETRWCLIRINDKKGWVLKSAMFGYDV